MEEPPRDIIAGMTDPTPTAINRLTPFGDLPAEHADPATAAIAVLPVPYDRTSSWKKGADRGPAALLDASANLELYDIPTGTEVYQRGIATLDPVVTDEPPDVMTDHVDRDVAQIYKRGQFPVVIGGEHSVSIGAIRAAARRFESLSVLQIDAHADTRETYDGSAFNHACVMARARQWCSITQVGIRAIDADEAPGLDPHRVFYAHDIVDQPGRPWIERAVATLSDAVYVTIDLDAFDSSVMPATGTPEPGGLTWPDVENLLASVARSRRVVGFDVVELLPTPGFWSCDFLAAKLVYRFLSEIFADR